MYVSLRYYTLLKFNFKVYQSCVVIEIVVTHILLNIFILMLKTWGMNSIEEKSFIELNSILNKINRLLGIRFFI